MKKVFLLVLCGVLLFGLCACVKTEEAKPEQESDVLPDPYETEKYRSTDVVTTQDGISLYFGLYRAVGFFKSGEPIDVYLSVTGQAWDGKTLTVCCYNDDKSVNTEQKITLSQTDGEEKLYGLRFAVNKNGAYHVRLIEGNTLLNINLGVCNPAETASDDFYYGSQAYLWRVYTWGTAYNETGREADDFADDLLDSMQYMGVNLLREDVSWDNVQYATGEELHTELLDKLINAVKAHNIHYNMLLNATADWAVDSDAVARAEEQGLANWQTKPDDEAWAGYVTKMAEKYANDESLLWEIWNEPDWEFFSGTEEEYLAMLRVAGEALKKVNPNAFVYAGGLAFAAGEYPEYVFAKDRVKLYAGYKTLIDEKVIDNFGIHIHGNFSEDDFLNYMETLQTQVESAGLTLNGVLNSECGCSSANVEKRANAVIRKCLWTRAHGQKMFVAYVHIALTENDKYVMFDRYLNPNLCAVEYTELIRRLGQSVWVENIADGDSVFADIYSDGTFYTVAAYTESGTATITLPADKTCVVYDAVGNVVENNSTVEIGESAVYIVFDRQVGAEEFEVK